MNVPENAARCDHQNHKEAYRFGAAGLLRCEACGLVFVDMPRETPSPDLVYEKYYRNETAARFNFGIEYVIRLFRFFRAFKMFTVCPGARTIMDIGSGRGFMLYYLKKYYGYTRAAGIQISRNAVEFSRNRLGLEIYDKDLLELPLDNARFEVITMWHVLEHLTGPDKYIEKISGLLGERGKLIIEVPNFNSWTRVFTRGRWLSLDLKHHLTFFTPESLTLMLERHGFAVETVHTFSLEYSVFTSLQSIVSWLTNSDHDFFTWLQGGDFTPRIIFHSLLFVALSPLCFLINALLYFSKYGEVIFIVAGKKCGQPV
ncbi:MAG: class I SAM-dependent methyltransferase [Elusimicrobiota bacterium]|nr:class I SAM-dependent methyltransferase [Elusimicrobiota bacterium]